MLRGLRSGMGNMALLYTLAIVKAHHLSAKSNLNLL